MRRILSQKPIGFEELQGRVFCWQACQANVIPSAPYHHLSQRDVPGFRPAISQIWRAFSCPYVFAHPVKATLNVDDGAAQEMRTPKFIALRMGHTIPGGYRKMGRSVWQRWGDLLLALFLCSYAAEAGHSEQ
jgi:hypothetical protein